jgi:DNA-binding response OmpR family regulator
MRVLLVEDDPMIGKALSLALGDAGMAVDWVRTGEHAGAALSDDNHAIVLLDLGLPDCDGLDLLRDARRTGNRSPILILTARDAVDSRIEGLDIGADDYIAKPFDMGELLARIRAVMRRRHGGQAVSTVSNGEIEIDLESHVVSFRGVSHLLSAKEFALMRALMARPGAILSRGQLEEQLYGWGEEVESNAVDVLIHYVRRKFGKDVIRNVRGAGWMIERASK